MSVMFPCAKLIMMITSAIILKTKDIKFTTSAYGHYFYYANQWVSSNLKLIFFHFSGFVVLILFTFVLLIQFLAMIVHRVGTLTHFLGRAPYKGNEAYNTSWAFDDRYDKETTKQGHTFKLTANQR